jgi:hypothetical protein
MGLGTRRRLFPCPKLEAAIVIPEKFTVRLGDLRQPLEAWCDKHDETPSEAVRLAVAKLLGVEPPAMDGHLANLRQNQQPKPPSPKGT